MGETLECLLINGEQTSKHRNISVKASIVCGNEQTLMHRTLLLRRGSLWKWTNPKAPNISVKASVFVEVNKP